MLCCGSCFNDRGLRKQIIPRLATSIGDCPTCGSSSVELVDAFRLGDYFESLCTIYSSSTDGKVLVDWLIEDWKLFSIDRATANNLLVEILDNGERVRELVQPSPVCDSENLDRWTQLRDELRGRNRFFPATAFEHDRLEELFSSLMFDSEDWQDTWHRARIEKEGIPYQSEEMGPPPAKLATHGRANPPGIPYLYLGSTAETATAEVRPHPGEKVCVASVSVPLGTASAPQRSTVVDLRNPRELVSPFLLGDDNEIALMRGDITFLERLGEELTSPVLPDAAAIDYIPSQYLCEFIKKCGYAGVVYSSSVTTGMNLALFDPSIAIIGDVAEYTVNAVSLTISQV